MIGTRFLAYQFVGSIYCKWFCIPDIIYTVPGKVWRSADSILKVLCA